jgi:hypothetical protein
MTVQTFSVTVTVPSGSIGQFPSLSPGESVSHTYGGYAHGYSLISWPNGGDNGVWLSGHIRGYLDLAAGTEGKVYYFCSSHEFDSTLTGVQQFLVYDIGTNSFSRPWVGWSSTLSNTSTVHSWDQDVFDFTNRRFLMMIHQETNIRWAPVDGPFPPSCEQTRILSQTVDGPAGKPVQQWPILTANPYNSSAHNAMKWHPNLFGPGQGAIVIVTGGSQRAIRAYRDGIGWTQILGPNGETQYRSVLGTGECTAIYSPTLDMVIGGGGDYPESPGENVRIYYDTTLTPPRPVWRYNQSQTPAEIWPDAIDSRTGAPAPLGATQFNVNHRLMLHPDGTPLILENSREPKAEARVKKLNTATWQWEDTGYHHPFNSPNWGANNNDNEGGCRDWPIVTIPDRPGIPGLLMGLRGVNPDTMDEVHKMILWRPQ